MRTKVARERLDAPRHVAGVADGCECTQALIGAWVFEGDRHGTVAAHAVAHD